MPFALPALRRRGLLAAGAGAALGAPGAWAQPSATRPLMVAQLFDTSASEQDVAKDFLVGARAAWQEINLHGGLRGRPVVHQAIEVDGSATGLRQAWNALKDNPACVALSGTVSDPLASQFAALLAQDNAAIAHAAPWLQNSSQEMGDATFSIFAGRREQIAHALKSLSVMGVQDVGAVFATPRDLALYRADVAQIAADLKLKLATYQANGDLVQLGQRLGPATPALLLFVGGTPELVQFTQGLDRQARQRYVIALADVNLQTVLQMGGGKATPIIATQAVPMAGSPLPVVRRYREAMARFFDEPPVALSLAGYIAARYTFEVMNSVDGALTRASVLAAFRRRAEVDVGGYRVSFDQRRRSATFVTQSMLTPDGRVVG
jgi:ABC-type branched-subunit amino acid transport system substrate-binding protein